MVSNSLIFFILLNLVLPFLLPIILLVINIYSWFRINVRLIQSKRFEKIFIFPYLIIIILIPFISIILFFIQNFSNIVINKIIVELLEILLVLGLGGWIGILIGSIISLPVNIGYKRFGKLEQKKVLLGKLNKLWIKMIIMVTIIFVYWIIGIILNSFSGGFSGAHKFEVPSTF